MFHVEQFFVLLLGVAMAPLPCSAELFLSDACAEHPISMGGEVNEQTERLTNLGFEFLLYGAEEEACEAFHQAAAEDEASPLTDLGLVLCATSKDERHTALQHLEQHLEEASLTPQEAFFLQTMLLFANGDTRGAAEEFLTHAEQFRRDRLSLSWGILLLHYTATDEATQQRCLNLASEFHTRFPEDSTAAYLRALCEEFSQGDDISKEGLECAQQAANRFPYAKALYGHLLFRKGMFEEAIKVFHVAQSETEKNSYLNLSMRLYESTALWCAGRTKEALRSRRDLNASLKLAGEPGTRAELLWRWEANSLPLRVLLTRPDKFDLSDIRAAKRALKESGKEGQGSAVQIYGDCLVHLSLARYHFRMKKPGEASKFLVLAEQDLKKLREQEAGTSSFAKSLFTRACQACEQGIWLVRSEVYQSTSDTWKEKLNESDNASTLLLPPVLPRR